MQKVLQQNKKLAQNIIKELNKSREFNKTNAEGFKINENQIMKFMHNLPLVILQIEEFQMKQTQNLSCKNKEGTENIAEAVTNNVISTENELELPSKNENEGDEINKIAEMQLKQVQENMKLMLQHIDNVQKQNLLNLQIPNQNIASNLQNMMESQNDMINKMQANILNNFKKHTKRMTRLQRRKNNLMNRIQAQTINKNFEEQEIVTEEINKLEAQMNKNLAEYADNMNKRIQKLSNNFNKQDSTQEILKQLQPALQALEIIENMPSDKISTKSHIIRKRDLLDLLITGFEMIPGVPKLPYKQMINPLNVKMGLDVKGNVGFNQGNMEVIGVLGGHAGLLGMMGGGSVGAKGSIGKDGASLSLGSAAGYGSSNSEDGAVAMGDTPEVYQSASNG